MPLVSSTQFGASYRFGLSAADAPVITGFVARSAELRWETEYFGDAKNKEGHTVAAVVSKPTKRKIVAVFAGYILNGFKVSDLPENFTFENRFYIVVRAQDPRRKGEFLEVSLEAESFANIITK